MNAWKIILATLVIFAAGVVTGGLVVGYANHTQPKVHRLALRDAANRRLENPQPAMNPREPALLPRVPNTVPQWLRMDFLQRLNGELQLTEEQHRQIEGIIKEGQERNQQLWKRALPEMRREIQATKDRIRGVLDPQQVRRFEELMKQHPPRRTGEPMPADRRRPDLRDQRRPLSPDSGAPQDRLPSPPAGNP